LRLGWLARAAIVLRRKLLRFFRPFLVGRLHRPGPKVSVNGVALLVRFLFARCEILESSDVVKEIPTFSATHFGLRKKEFMLRFPQDFTELHKAGKS
jgi:hypothetical protein